MTSENSWGSNIPVEVENGGTGRTTHTAYGVITGGTTTTSAQQSIVSVGTSGQVLTSAGAGALPTFEDAPAGGGGEGDTECVIYSDFQGSTITTQKEPGFAANNFTTHTSIVAGHSGIIENSGVDAEVYNAGWSNGNGTLEYLALVQDTAVFPAAADELWIGYGDSSSSPPSSNGIYFKRIGTDANWYAVCEASGTTTIEDTLIDGAAQWRSFQIEVNAAGTSAVFSIDGSVTNTITTNLPASTVFMYAGVWCESLAAGTLLIDAIRLSSTVASRI